MTESTYRSLVGEPHPDGALEKAFSRTPVRDVMSPVVAHAYPYEPMQDVAQPLLDAKIPHYPVIDDDGRPVGLLQREEVLRWQIEACRGQPTPAEAALFGIKPLVPARPDDTTVADVMESAVVAVVGHSGLDLVAAVLAHEGTPAALVTDGEGRLCGVVWAQQIMRWLAEQVGYVVPSLDPSSGSR